MHLSILEGSRLQSQGHTECFRGVLQSEAQGQSQESDALRLYARPFIHFVVT